ncbi:MAG: flagellar export chaperone FliS [Thermodesulfobacteriota bacterium]
MRQFDAYRKATVDTSDNVKLVSLLFDGAVNFLKVARGKMEQRDIAGKGIYIGKATAIVGELSSSLNMEEGGEIARNLRRLYDFVLGRLLHANLKNDMKALNEAERVLETLRQGWKEMEQNQAAAHAAAYQASAGTGARMAVQA